MMRKTIVFACVAVMLMTACGKDEPEGVQSVASPTTSGSKPVVEVPKGPAPKDLVIKDLTVGSGAEAVNGKKVTVHYVGVHYTDGKEFDSSWNSGQPFELSLPGGVIEGWNKGIPGMKVGGRRQLVIPPSMGYGAQGYPPVIQPNETLVFVIDLLKVE